MQARTPAYKKKFVSFYGRWSPPARLLRTVAARPSAARPDAPARRTTSQK